VFVLDALQRDIRQAFRSLSRRPALVAVAILSLALGIGANAVVFSALDALFWKPLPVPEAHRVVELVDTRNGEPRNGNPARARDYSERMQSVAGVGGLYGEAVILPGPQRVKAIRTFGPVLGTLGYRMALGRAFTPEEERGAAPVAVLTDAFWRRHFGGNPQVLNQPLRTAAGVFTIVGVLPPAAVYPRDTDFWAPASRDMQTDNRGASFIAMYARLRPGATVAALTAELAPLNAALARQYPETDKDIAARVLPFRDHAANEAQTPLLAMAGAVALVLLMACLNLSSLLLARGLERRKEAAIRASLGASAAALVRTFLAESLLLALAGGAAGLLLALWGVDALAGVLPSENPLAVDARVVAFTLGVTLLCAFLFGGLPAWQTARAGVGGRLSGWVRASATVSRMHWRGVLVAGQTALCLLLLTAAALLAGSFLRQKQAPAGFSPVQLTAARVNLSWDTPPDQLHGFIRQTLDRLAAMPGVEAAGVTDRLPLEGETQSGEIVLRGRELPPALARTRVHNRTASASYLGETLRVPLRAGRLFQAQPNRHEVVVNQTFAERFFPGVDPVGQAFAYGRQKAGTPPRWLEITGVVGDLRQRPGQTVPAAEYFHAPENSYWPMLTFVVRSSAPVGAVAANIREAVRQVDASQVVESITPIEDALGTALNQPRGLLWLSAAFSAIALLLALIGVYGLMASDVTQRTREFGIRLALGASRSQVLQAALRRGVALMLAGIAAGAAAAYFTNRLLTGLLYGVEPADPRFTLAAALLLLIASLAAALGPAWRGSQTDPAVTLRHE